MVEQAKPKRDIFPVLALTAGLAAAGVGLFLYLKKPPGFSPGEAVRCHFTFDYAQTGGTYVLQVWFGTRDAVILQWFIHAFGCTMEVNLPGPGKYEYDLFCQIPLASKAQSYDAEALIRTPEMGEFEYFVKRVDDEVIVIRSE